MGMEGGQMRSVRSVMAFKLSRGLLVMVNLMSNMMHSNRWSRFFRLIVERVNWGWRWLVKKALGGWRRMTMEGRVGHVAHLGRWRSIWSSIV